ASWLFVRLHIQTPITPVGRLEQALILGASSYLLWKFPLGVILLLHLLNSYIYFGKHPFWKYVGATAQTILRPLNFVIGGWQRPMPAARLKKNPLQVGKVDFAPVAGIALIFLAAHF